MDWFVEQKFDVGFALAFAVERKPTL